MKRCIHFDGGCCYADWKDEQGNSIRFGEGCWKNTHDSCPHEKLVEFIECPACHNDALNIYICETCYGEGYVADI
jgi:cytochrome c